MANKARPLRKVDERRQIIMPVSGGGSSLIAVAPPGSGSIPSGVGVPQAPVATTVGQSVVVLGEIQYGVIAISWTAVNADMYLVQIDAASDFSTASTRTYPAGSTANAALIELLEPDTTYYLRVAGTGDETIGAWSNTLTVAISAAATPPTPTGGAMTLGNSFALITWDAPAQTVQGTRVRMTRGGVGFYDEVHDSTAALVRIGEGVFSYATTLNHLDAFGNSSADATISAANSDQGLAALSAANAFTGANTFSAGQTFNSYIDFAEIATPSAPAANVSRIYAPTTATQALPLAAQQAGSADVFPIPSYIVADWTPAIGASTTDGTLSYTTQVGRLMRIGNLIYALFNVIVNVVTVTPTGNVQVIGLPNASRNAANQTATGAASIFTSVDLTAGYSQVGVFIAANSSRAQLSQGGDNVAGANISAATVVNGFRVTGFIMYEV